jgi:hypothetical protein
LVEFVGDVFVVEWSAVRVNPAAAPKDLDAGPMSLV